MAEQKKNEKQSGFLGSIWFKLALVVVILVAAFGVRTFLEQRHEEESEEQTKTSTRNIEYAESVAEDNPIRQAFQAEFPEAEIILACQEDVTDDGLSDLVVVYRQGNLTRTVVAVDSGDSQTYYFTDPIPAPRENQKIQFKNIDKEGEMEFVITGEKDGAVGYAIYRMIDGQPQDLFGEGMEDCC